MPRNGPKQKRASVSRADLDVNDLTYPRQGIPLRLGPFREDTVYATQGLFQVESSVRTILATIQDGALLPNQRLLILQTLLLHFDLLIDNVLGDEVVMGGLQFAGTPAIAGDKKPEDELESIRAVVSNFVRTWRMMDIRPHTTLVDLQPTTSPGSNPLSTLQQPPLMHARAGQLRAGSNSPHSDNGGGKSPTNSLPPITRLERASQTVSTVLSPYVQGDFKFNLPASREFSATLVQHQHHSNMTMFVLLFAFLMAGALSAISILDSGPIENKAAHCVMAFLLFGCVAFQSFHVTHVGKRVAIEWKRLTWNNPFLPNSGASVARPGGAHMSPPAENLLTQHTSGTAVDIPSIGSRVSASPAVQHHDSFVAPRGLPPSTPMQRLTSAATTVASVTGVSVNLPSEHNTTGRLSIAPTPSASPFPGGLPGLSRNTSMRGLREGAEHSYGSVISGGAVRGETFTIKIPPMLVANSGIRAASSLTGIPTRNSISQSGPPLVMNGSGSTANSDVVPQMPPPMLKQPSLQVRVPSKAFTEGVGITILDRDRDGDTLPDRFHVMFWSDSLASATGIQAVDLMGKNLGAVLDDRSAHNLKLVLKSIFGNAGNQGTLGTSGTSATGERGGVRAGGKQPLRRVRLEYTFGIMANRATMHAVVSPAQYSGPEGNRSVVALVGALSVNSLDVRRMVAGFRSALDKFIAVSLTNVRRQTASTTTVGGGTSLRSDSSRTVAGGADSSNPATPFMRSVSLLSMSNNAMAPTMAALGGPPTGDAATDPNGTAVPSSNTSFFGSPEMTPQNSMAGSLFNSFNIAGTSTVGHSGLEVAAARETALHANLEPLFSSYEQWTDDVVDTSTLLAEVVGDQLAIVDIEVDGESSIPPFFACNVRSLREAVADIVNRIQWAPQDIQKAGKLILTIAPMVETGTDSNVNTSDILLANALLLTIDAQRDVALQSILEQPVVNGSLKNCSVVLHSTNSAVTLVFPIMTPRSRRIMTTRAVPLGATADDAAEPSPYEQPVQEEVYHSYNSHRNSDSNISSEGSMQGFMLADLQRNGGNEATASRGSISNVSPVSLKVLVFESSAVMRSNVVSVLVALGHCPVVLDTTTSMQDLRLLQLLHFNTRSIDVAIIDTESGAAGEQLIMLLKRHASIGIVRSGPASASWGEEPTVVASDARLRKPASAHDTNAALLKAYQFTGRTVPAEAAARVRETFVTHHHEDVTFYTRKSQLGKGGQGVVWRTIQGASGIESAMKEVTFQGDEPAAVSLQQLIETQLSPLQHPNLVQIYASTRSQTKVQIYMELCSGGTLLDYSAKMRARGYIDPIEVALITWHILRGLQHLHEVGKIAHRDLKPENVLISQHLMNAVSSEAAASAGAAGANKANPNNLSVNDKDRTPGGFLKLADFGVGAKNKATMGTPRYMSGDAVHGSTDPAVDIWALGIMVMELFDKLPTQLQKTSMVSITNLYGNAGDMENMRRGHPLPFAVELDRLGMHAKDFVTSCLQMNPHLRPTARSLQYHPFIIEALNMVASAHHGVNTSTAPAVRGVSVHGPRAASEFTCMTESDSEEDDEDDFDF